jgi:hypothetical protein
MNVVVERPNHEKSTMTNHDCNADFFAFASNVDSAVVQFLILPTLARDFVEWQQMLVARGLASGTEAQFVRGRAIHISIASSESGSCPTSIAADMCHSAMISSISDLHMSLLSSRIERWFPLIQSARVSVFQRQVHQKKCSVLIFVGVLLDFELFVILHFFTYQ